MYDRSQSPYCKFHRSPEDSPREHFVLKTFVLWCNEFDPVKPISIKMNVLSGLAEYSHGAEYRSLDFNPSLQQPNI